MQNEQVLPDPFWPLVHDSTVPKATVQSEVSRSHDTGGGWVKCSFTIAIDCPQTKGHIDAAAELAFKTALGFVNDGMSYLAPGLPPLESK